MFIWLERNERGPNLAFHFYRINGYCIVTVREQTAEFVAMQLSPLALNVVKPEATTCSA
jgi:hypothetical protein